VAEPSVWFLNLDADLELARPRGYAPTAAVLARMRTERARARGLLAPGDFELEEGEPLPSAAHGLPGRAWCMTPRAERALRAAGALPISAPALEVLQRVNARAFAHGLGCDPGDGLCTPDPAQVLDRIASAPAGARWLAKRAHGMAGRGLRRIDAGAVTDADRSWLARACTDGAILLEPRRELVLECIVHGELDQDGGLRLGPVCEQVCDEHGAWKATTPTSTLEGEEAELLYGTAKTAARALADAGYHGPFGVDSCAWQVGGRRCWRPLSDLNARHTMGWRRDRLHPVDLTL